MNSPSPYIQNEVLDMSGQQDKFTLKDMKKSGMGGTIISILM